jgi:hypothetical protein
MRRVVPPMAELRAHQRQAAPAPPPFFTQRVLRCTMLVKLRADATAQAADTTEPLLRGGREARVSLRADALSASGR